MAMVSKAKNPEVVMNPASAEHYKKYGNTLRLVIVMTTSLAGR